MEKNPVLQGEIDRVEKVAERSGTSQAGKAYTIPAHREIYVAVHGDTLRFNIDDKRFVTMDESDRKSIESLRRGDKVDIEFQLKSGGSYRDRIFVNVIRMVKVIAQPVAASKSVAALLAVVLSLFVGARAQAIPLPEGFPEDLTVGIYDTSTALDGEFVDAVFDENSAFGVYTGSLALDQDNYFNFSIYFDAPFTNDEMMWYVDSSFGEFTAWSDYGEFSMPSEFQSFCFSPLIPEPSMGLSLSVPMLLCLRRRRSR